MGEMMQEVGGDGFLFFLGDVSRKTRGGDHRRADPRFAAARPDADRLRRKHLRDNLLEF